MRCTDLVPSRGPLRAACFLYTVALVLATAGLAPVAALAADSTAVATPPAATPLPAPKLGGYVQVRELAQEHVGLTSYLNRARFSVGGSLPPRFTYRLLTELEASAGAKSAATVSLREATIAWNPAPFTLTAGEFKTPFTREYLIPVPALELADLATVVDSLAPKYDVGLALDYALGASATVTLGVFNGEGANAIANRDSNVMFVARVAGRPLPQLALGASATRDGADSLRWGVDASVQQSGAAVRAEYVTRHRRGRDTSKDDFGWTVFESYRATPRIQLVARQEDFQRPLKGAAARLRGLAWGSNVEIAPNRVRLLLELSRRMSGKKQLHADTFLAQMQVQF